MLDKLIQLIIQISKCYILGFYSLYVAYRKKKFFSSYTIDFSKICEIYVKRKKKLFGKKSNKKFPFITKLCNVFNIN